MAKKFEKHCDARGIVAKVCMMRGKDGKWFWHAKGYNHEITCCAEGFSRKNACYDSALDHARQFKVPFYVEVAE